MILFTNGWHPAERAPELHGPRGPYRCRSEAPLGLAGVPVPEALAANALGLLLGHRADDQLVVRTLAVLPERWFTGVGP